MKRIKKRYIYFFSLFLLLGIAATIIIVYFPNLFYRYTIPKTVDVFGTPIAKMQQNFPASHPEFTAIIGFIKPASLHQQSIVVYQTKNAKKISVFERPFYADSFRGNKLSYSLSSNSAEITQNGSLATLGCNADDCTLPWTNFYTWDASQHSFVLDNLNHKDAFQQLLLDYQTIDKNGCTIVGSNLISTQEGLSFTEIYKKFPTASFYCSESEGLLPSNIVFLLQAEKTLQEIVAGQNFGSDDIRDIQL